MSPTSKAGSTRRSPTTTRAGGSAGFCRSQSRARAGEPALGDWEAASALYEYREPADDAGLPAAAAIRAGAANRCRASGWCCSPSRAGRHDPVLPLRSAARGARLRCDAPRAGADAAAAVDAGRRHDCDAWPTRRAINGRPIRWLPLMSVPGVLGVAAGHAAGERALSRGRAGARRALGRAARRDGFKIGINWASGTPRDWYGRQRDIPLGRSRRSPHSRRAAGLAAEGPAVERDRARRRSAHDRDRSTPIPTRRATLPRHRGADDAAST